MLWERFTMADYTFESWIADLRSGKYEQGKRRLRHSDGTFCCLGVLEEGLGRLVEGKDALGGPGWVDVEDGNSMNPPASVATQIGLPINDNTCQSNNDSVYYFEPLVLDVDGSQLRATATNDGYDWTFDQIADGLERAKNAGLYD